MINHQTISRVSEVQARIPERRGKKKAWRLWLIAGVVSVGILFMIGLLGGENISLTSEANILDATNSAKSEEAARQVKEAISLISRHFLLPGDETPTLATVVDVEKLRIKQPFFAQAMNGDVVLLFAKMRQAILYSPKRDRVVNAGPIEYDSASASEINNR